MRFKGGEGGGGNHVKNMKFDLDGCVVVSSLRLIGDECVNMCCDACDCVVRYLLMSLLGLVREGLSAAEDGDGASDAFIKVTVEAPPVLVLGMHLLALDVEGPFLRVGVDASRQHGYEPGRNNRARLDLPIELW